MSQAADTLWKAAPPPHPDLLICVVVPVRNEAAGLAATLHALAAQETLRGEPFPRTHYEILLLANNCTDESARIAKRLACECPELALHVDEISLPPVDAHIGHVRKLLMDAACHRLTNTPCNAGIVSSTDGDTVVGTRWLAEMLEEFDTGVDAVGGRILLDAQEPMDAATLRWHRCDMAYRLATARLEALLDPNPADPWPRHHQHFGASLAVRRDAYLSVGGVPDVRFLEDEALVTALRRADFQVRHSPRVRVRTSARRDGRVEVGLSWQLRQWGDRHAGDPAMWVESADSIAAALRARRSLRELRAGCRSGCRRELDARAIAAVTSCYALPHPDWLHERVAYAKTFGALWIDVQALDRVTPQPSVPVRDAIDGLQSLIGRHPGRSAALNTSSR